MDGDQRPDESEAKWPQDSFLRSALAILAAVLIPNVLKDAVGLTRSWGNVIGVAVASTLAYFFLPGPRKNCIRFVLIILGLCVFGYIIGYYLE
jgi:drug/metabolite transporter (DMT)-like permease